MSSADRSTPSRSSTRPFSIATWSSPARRRLPATSIDTEDLRRACEIQARGHLIHLRQGWIQAGGHQSHLIDVIVRSAAPFRALLSNVARLHDAPHATETDLAGFAQAVIGMPPDVVARILDLDVHPEHGRKAVCACRRYLAAAEQLWNFVDSWRRS